MMATIPCVFLMDRLPRGWSTFTIDLSLTSLLSFFSSINHSWQTVLWEPWPVYLIVFGVTPPPTPQLLPDLVILAPHFQPSNNLLLIHIRLTSEFSSIGPWYLFIPKLSYFPLPTSYLLPSTLYSLLYSLLTPSPKLRYLIIEEPLRITADGLFTSYLTFCQLFLLD